MKIKLFEEGIVQARIISGNYKLRKLFVGMYIYIYILIWNIGSWNAIWPNIQPRTDAVFINHNQYINFKLLLDRSCTTLSNQLSYTVIMLHAFPSPGLQVMTVYAWNNNSFPFSYFFPQSCNTLLACVDFLQLRARGKRPRSTWYWDYFPLILLYNVE